MSTKKKPASKPVPTPLLKLKFEKFPDKQVGVYFEPTKRCFYADFGFEQYESPSVAGLEQKIKAAIKRGAAPDVRWTPVILIALEHDNCYRQPGADNADRHIDFSLERKYIAITKEGLREVAWNVPEQKRKANAGTCHDLGYTMSQKLKVLPKLPIADKGNSPMLMVPYSDQLWETLRAISGQIQIMYDSLGSAIRSRDFSKVFIPKAAAAPKPALRPSTPKVKPMPNRERRTDRELKPAASADSKQPSLPLHDAAQKPIVIGKLKKKSKPQRGGTNGDHSAREHLEVKYQGNTLTLGHGPLGNYLVEALRKTYPTIHSAFCLKDNQVQISLQGVAEPRTISGADFERLINNPEPPSQSGNMYGRQALQNLRSLTDGFNPTEDKPIAIPALIMAAAGFPASAAADIHDLDEVIVRIPKKAPQFMSVFAFEERIRQRIPDKLEREAAAEPAQKAVNS